MIPQTALSESTLEQAILLTITYADVFDYPLTTAEIHRYLTGLRVTPEHVIQKIQRMSGVAQTGEYFTLPSRQSIVTLRQERQQTSARLWAHAVRYGQWIASLPYVRMVAVTGSLAMDNTGSSADIDYLIVTAPGHLWLCRAMILVLRRAALLEGINLCPNYLITTRALHFPDQNLYAAHELAQMIPLNGLDIYHEIRKQNEWVNQYLPNAQGIPLTSKVVAFTEVVPRFRPVLERILQDPLVAKLEQWEMKRKIEMLTREQSDSLESCFSEDVCKGHADLHGALTNEAFHKRLSNLPIESLL